MLLGALGLLAVAGIAAAVIAMKAVPGKPKPDAGNAAPHPALAKAQERVSKELSPRKVEFDDKYNLQQIRDDEWSVESHLEFSATDRKRIRQAYSARVRKEGPDGWQVASLEIGGRRVAMDGGSRKAPPPPDNDPSGRLPDVLSRPDLPEREDRSVNRALRSLADVIDESVQSRPTLVVWLFDTSPLASGFRDDVLGGFDVITATFQKHKPAAKEPPKLRMAAVAFDDEVRLVTPQPVADGADFRKQLGEIASGKGGHERPFAALQLALDKFGEFAKRGERLTFILVTDEAGDDDEKVVESVIPELKKNAIPVYVIGRESPFGRSAFPGNAGGEDPMHQGPESLFSERINLPFWQKSFGDEMFELPSGFGPYQLCRVANQTGGAYLICDGGSGGRIDFVPTFGSGGSDLRFRFDPKVLPKYAPKYVSAEEYRKLIASNGAARALHEAAKLPDFEMVNVLAFDFVAGDEAALSNALARAQQGVARTEPKISALYAALSPGIPDRNKLTEPRLQAGFDLAMGRVLAARARVEGYNAMLALLKGGRRFKNAGSSVWMLQASDKTDAGSKYEKDIRDAHVYLERVIKDHPGTPWAHYAQRELQAKMGWEWGER